MIIPIRTDYRMTQRPWVNYALVAVNIALYVMGYNAATVSGNNRIWYWMLHPDAPQIEQFFSCMFLHAGFGHILGNMIFLWVFGGAVNDRLGHLGYLLFYLAGGVLAGVGYVLMSGSSPVLGASGAISAVAGAYLVLLPRARVTVLALLVYVLMPFEVPSLFFLLFQFIWNLWMSLTPALTGQMAGPVAYVAHSSGYLFGIAVAAVLLAVGVLPRDPFDLVSLMRTWRRRQDYRRMVSGGYDPFRGAAAGSGSSTGTWYGPRKVEPPPLPMDQRETELRRQISQYFNEHDLPSAAERYLQLIQIADDVVLSRQQQLDVANQLMSAEQYPAAADAYERFLRHYGSGYEHVGDICLMLGLAYGRYLHQYDRAEEMLSRAIERLGDARKIELARGDLAAVRKLRGG